MHDRFMIIDKKVLYHIGASLKDLGKKCFAFEILDSSFIPDILKNIQMHNTDSFCQKQLLVCYNKTRDIQMKKLEFKMFTDR